MDILTAVVWIVGMLIAAYIVRLLILHRGDFEAGGRTINGEVFVKAKERKK